MVRRLVVFAVGAGWMLGAVSPAARTHVDPGECQGDSKAVGPNDGLIRLSTEDGDDTWWGITKAGLDSVLGPLTDAEYLSIINEWFGTSYASLGPAVADLVGRVEPHDANGNGYVCAFEVRGRRTWGGEAIPFLNVAVFAVNDDRPR